MLLPFAATVRWWGLRRRPPEEDPRRCSWCGDLSVCPMSTRPAGGGQQAVMLRCGNCGVWRELVLSTFQVVLLDAAVQADLELIAEDADVLERRSMAAWVRAVTAALRRDLLDAGDFERSLPVAGRHR